MNKNLAIIIPAFKATFLEETLTSIMNQTSKNFRLYIGDDASPDDLYAIVEKFESKIDLIYKRFDKNIGGLDLVAQWERCIDLSKDEEWLWLFSDDDMMDKNCVKEFFQAIDSGIKHDKDKVYRFKRSVIHVNNEITPEGFEMPQEYSVLDLMQKQNERVFGANITEHLFSRTLFNKMGGYVNFPLAWGSDGMTMLKFGSHRGFVSLESNVFWRSSEENLSNQKMYDLKINAEMLMNEWLFQFLQPYKKHHKIYKGQVDQRFFVLEHYLELPLKKLFGYISSMKGTFKISNIEYLLYHVPVLLKWKFKHDTKQFIVSNAPFVNNYMIKLKIWR